MKKIKVISVGRLKTPFWRDAAEHYRDRLSRGLQFEELEVKDSALADIPARQAQEAERLLAAAQPADYLIALDERGKAMTSPELAAWLEKLEGQARTPCFVIGGAYGLAESLRSRADSLLSFGPMTLPHELARVVLLEQLFRASAIVRNTGYHH